MKQFAADENFHGAIFDGLLKVIPELDIIRVQDTELYGKPDNILLEWLAVNGRILLTHDRKTMPGYVYARMAKGLSMPGVVIIDQDLAVGSAIDQLSTLIIALGDDEWENLIYYVPF